MAQVDMKVKNVIKIDPEGKYVVSVPEGSNAAYLQATIETLRTWWDSGDPFLVMPDSFKLVRVDEPEAVTE